MAYAICNINNLSNYTLEEFNDYLESNKPYNLEGFNEFTSNSSTNIANSILYYLDDFKIIVCSNCKTFITSTKASILKHFKEKHPTIYRKNTKANKAIFSELENNIQDFLDNNSFNTFEDLNLNIEYNLFYYNYLEIKLGYKSRVYNFTNISRISIL